MRNCPDIGHVTIGPKKQRQNENSQTKKIYDKQYSQTNAEHIKQRQNEHGQTKKEYDEKYRQTNADRIKQRQNKRLTCECGGRFTKVNKAAHFRTKNHCKYEYQQIYDFIYL